VHSINLADDLRIEPADELLVRMEGVQLSPGPNLVAQAAELLIRRTGARSGARLTLIKGIPEAAGLGGGSSDAATTLIGLNRFWRLGLGEADLRELGAELGSDVPFFIRGGAALMRGRGDQLEPVQPLAQQYFGLVVPRHTLANKTARLYAALGPGDYSSGETTRQAATRLAHGQSLHDEHLTNAFSGAARELFEDLSIVWDLAEAACARRFHLTGAGPTLFCLAADRGDAQQQAERLRGRGCTAYVCKAVGHARPAAIEYI
jgi:4-diphosphocytidyl-2-C-methyl-D-erythritol kinase